MVYAVWKGRLRDPKISSFRMSVMPNAVTGLVGLAGFTRIASRLIGAYRSITGAEMEVMLNPRRSTTKESLMYDNRMHRYSLWNSENIRMIAVSLISYCITYKTHFYLTL